MQFLFHSQLQYFLEKNSYATCKILMVACISMPEMISPDYLYLSQQAKLASQLSSWTCRVFLDWSHVCQSCTRVSKDNPLLGVEGIYSTAIVNACMQFYHSLKRYGQNVRLKQNTFKQIKHMDKSTLTELIAFDKIQQKQADCCSCIHKTQIIRKKAHWLCWSLTQVTLC